MGCDVYTVTARKDVQNDRKKQQNEQEMTTGKYMALLTSSKSRMESSVIFSRETEKGEKEIVTEDSRRQWASLHCHDDIHSEEEGWALQCVCLIENSYRRRILLSIRVEAQMTEKNCHRHSLCVNPPHPHHECRFSLSMLSSSFPFLHLLAISLIHSLVRIRKYWETEGFISFVPRTNTFLVKEKKDVSTAQY